MKKVLIVDDAPMVLKILDMALSMEGYEVTKAGNGNEALDRIKEQKFDVGIFDVNMPGMTGIELIPKALSLPNGKDMQIVMLTTESSQEMQKQARDAGASAWIIKPFKNDDLINLLGELLED
ncbi:MAG: response regulator [Leptospiraceae bacterium]|nr:response regulator [Leptospiraceae bacterium]MCP5499893.1 response regulator [Leptospiraceae bacterium]